MVIELIVVGKTVGAWLESGIREYTDRLAHYVRFSITVIPELKNARNMREEQIKIAEGELILDKTASGRLRRSARRKRAAARRIRSLCRPAPRHYESRNTATRFRHRRCIRLFSHRLRTSRRKTVPLATDLLAPMVRLIFVEQLYRAFTILGGEPYHHR